MKLDDNNIMLEDSIIINENKFENIIEIDNKPEINLNVKEETSIENEVSTSEQTAIAEKNVPKELISNLKLLECGVQYGHETKRWNPLMKPFIQKIKIMGPTKKKVYIINTLTTKAALNNAYSAIRKISRNGGVFLFVGTNPKFKKTIELNAVRSGSFYVNHRWLGGTLTNFKTIQNSINRLRNLERIEKTGYKGYTKKEGLELSRELEKLQQTLNGIKYMRRLPSAIFVASVSEEKIAIKEAKKFNIPVFGIVDTNEDPYQVQFPIFANDDSNKSVSLITTIIADTITMTKNGETKAIFKADEDVEIVGLDAIKKVNSVELLSKVGRNNLNQGHHLKEDNRDEKKIALEIEKETIVEEKPLDTLVTESVTLENTNQLNNTKEN